MYNLKDYLYLISFVIPRSLSATAFLVLSTVKEELQGVSKYIGSHQKQFSKDEDRESKSKNVDMTDKMELFSRDEDRESKTKM